MFSAVKNTATRSKFFKIQRLVTLALFLFLALALQVQAENENVRVSKDFQVLVARALSGGLQKHQAKSGFAILVDPQSGQVLALSRQVRKNESYQTVSPSEVLRTSFEPYSLLKPLIAAIAFERQLVNENTVLDARGGKIQFGDRY